MDTTLQNALQTYLGSWYDVIMYVLPWVLVIAAALLAVKLSWKFTLAFFKTLVTVDTRGAAPLNSDITSLYGVGGKLPATQTKIDAPITTAPILTMEQKPMHAIGHGTGFQNAPWNIAERRKKAGISTLTGSKYSSNQLSNFS